MAKSTLKFAGIQVNAPASAVAVARVRYKVGPFGPSSNKSILTCESFVLLNESHTIVPLQERDITMTHALRQAITTERFLADAIKRGEQILLRDGKTKAVRELLLR